MSKELELIAAGMAATSPTSTEWFENMSQWNQQRWLSRASHVVSVLAASGHTIMPTSEVNSLNAFRWKALQGLAAASAAEEDTND